MCLIFLVTIIQFSSRNCYDQEQTPPQRNNYTVGSIAGGSLACTFALGMFLTCFYRRVRPPAERGHPAIKSTPVKYSSAFVYLHLITLGNLLHMFLIIPPIKATII